MGKEQVVVSVGSDKGGSESVRKGQRMWAIKVWRVCECVDMSGGKGGDCEGVFVGVGQRVRV